MHRCLFCGSQLAPLVFVTPRGTWFVSCDAARIAASKYQGHWGGRGLESRVMRVELRAKVILQGSLAWVCCDC